MTAKRSLWQRIVQFIRPERESYDSRRTRPGAVADTPNSQFSEPTDQRRSNWGP